MDRSVFHGLSVFLAIAKAGSLRGAARLLNVNPPAVSHQLKVFEEWIGTPLFVRSTRSIALTEAGQSLLRGSQPLVQGLDDTLQVTRQLGIALGGTLRINLPYRAWQLTIAPKLPSFRKTYPNIHIEFTIEEGFVDIIETGMHAGIRLGDSLQVGMVRRQLCGHLDATIVASPDYLREHGSPCSLEDLADYTCIGYRGATSGQIQAWSFLQNGQERSITPRTPLVFNDMRTAVDAAEQGLGLAWSLRKGVEKKVQSGVLQETLTKYAVSRPGFYIYYPRQSKEFPLLVTFLDHFTR